MTEILTESFCERCGTRYTFESARSRTRLTGVRTLSRGLKNFVLSDDTSMDEAMAAARSETERETTAHQLDAFHKTFTFCMSCRQYTCPNCWNEAEARCLTCAPREEPAPAAFEEAPAAAAGLVADPWGMNGTNGSRVDTGTPDGFEAAEAEAALDLEPDDVDVAARLDTLTLMPSAVEAPVVAEAPAPAPVEVEQPGVASDAGGLAPEPEVGAGPIVAEPTVEEPVVAEAVAAEPQAPADGPTEVDHVDLADLAAAAIVVDAVAAEPSEETTAASKAGGRGGALRRRFRPGQNLDAELDAYERDHAAAIAAAATAAAVPEAGAQADGSAAVEPEALGADVAPAAEAAAPELVAEPEPVMVAAPEPEPVPELVAEPEPEMVAAPEPEPVAEPAVVAATEPEMVAEPEPEMLAEPEPEPEPVAEPEIAAAAVAASHAAGEPDTSPSDHDLAAAALAAAALAGAPPSVEPESPDRVVDDIVPQPTWQMVAPDPTPDVAPVSPAEPPSLPAAARSETGAEPQWPAPRPEYLGNSPAAGLPFLGRPAAPTGGVEALWAESTRVVSGPTPAATAGVQPCVSCGLSLSATARFCRRCGTAQAR